MCLSTEPPVWTFERESTDSNPVLTLNRVNWATSVKICNRVDMTWTHVRGATDCTELRLSRCTINLYNLSIITLHGSNGFRRPLKLGRPSCTNSTFRIVNEIDIVNCAKLWCIQRYIATQSNFAFIHEPFLLESFLFSLSLYLSLCVSLSLLTCAKRLSTS